MHINYARNHRRASMSDRALRSDMYGQYGGLYYGIHRLMLYKADYDKPLYRFADYNSGMYSSRNAAFQQRVAVLSGKKLDIDGDLLLYSNGGVSDKKSQTEQALISILSTGKTPTPDWQIRSDLKKEKRQSFESTQTYQKINELYKEKNDILVGITTPATLSLANATKETPIIMAGITYPVEAGLIASEDKPGNNITGVSDRTPIKQQLELMKEILPNLKKVGLLYTSSEDNSIKQIEEAKKYAAELGIEVKLASIANTNDIQQVTESLASEVDAIFVPIDNTIASAMATVVKVTDKFKIGVFPSADTMVADGGVLGLGVDQYQIGVETAKVIVEVLNGKKPADTPIVLANEGVIYLNEEKAKELGIEIPENIKAKAQIVK